MIAGFIENETGSGGGGANGLRGIVELFDVAISNGLKFPKIRFDGSTAAGTPLVLKRAGEASRYHGQVTVADAGRFPDNKYFGRIDRAGEFVAGRDCTPLVRSFLEQLASGAASVAGLYGQETGQCCFCARRLTDKRSVTVGYGPDCAAKYSLPWGEPA